MAEMEEADREGKSLAETPTWAVSTVFTFLIGLSFICHATINKSTKWLAKTKRKSLFAALENVKEELMLFGLLSLLMGHWIHFVAKICVKKSTFNSRFYPCVPSSGANPQSVEHIFWLNSKLANKTVFKEQLKNGSHDYCGEGYESFASHESLEQLHRFVFVLGITHVSYSFVAVALAILKIYSWTAWEKEAKTMANHGLQETLRPTIGNIKLGRLTSFTLQHASHPWSQHSILVWLLSFSRQFWSSINRADYMALRLGFITTHQLPLTYDFHSYMLRSMDDEFSDIVGVSVPLWIYAICCIFLDFHGTYIYFWLSFIPSILILIIGTKLHRVEIKLAVEVMENLLYRKNHHFNLRDELFWFGKPKLLLRLIHLISFVNAFEMATFIWSLWEIKEPSCFMNNRTLIVIRLSSGIISQVWCSFITFPLYVIITQMGSRFKKTVISENVRKSLSKWQRRVKDKQSSSPDPHTATSAASSDSGPSEIDELDDYSALSNEEGSSSGTKDISLSHLEDGSEIQRIEQLRSHKEYRNDGIEEELSVLAALP